MHMKKWKHRIGAVLAAALLFTGCGMPVDDEDVPLAVPEYVDFETWKAENLTPYDSNAGAYQGVFNTAEYHPDKAQGTASAKIDVSEVSKGYVAASAFSQKRLKFQVIANGVTYNYDMQGDGTPAIFPLQLGNASYKFRIMENTTAKKYAELTSVTVWVQLESDFAPYVRTNNYVKYTSASACVQKAAELAAGASDTVGVIAKVYEFVCSTVKYDYQKANTVTTGYLPDPDSTMNTGMGICFDYAALAAAMLRSQGIPTKMVLGYVAPNSLYHAWNMFYTEETGWVTVNFQIAKGVWNRLDLTFSAGGGDGYAQFIGNGTNYTDVYYY